MTKLYGLIERSDAYYSVSIIRGINSYVTFGHQLLFWDKLYYKLISFSLLLFRFAFFLEEVQIYRWWSWKNKCHPNFFQAPTSTVRSLENRIQYTSELKRLEPWTFEVLFPGGRRKEENKSLTVTTLSFSKLLLIKFEFIWKQSLNLVYFRSCQYLWTQKIEDCFHVELVFSKE